MLYTSLYSFPLSHPDFLVTPSHSLKPLVSDSRFSSQPQFSFVYLFFNVESHPVAAMLTASLAFSPVSFTSLTFSHRLPKPHPGLYHYLTVLHLWNLNFKVPPCVQIVTLPALSLSLNIILLHSDLSSLEATSMNSLISTSFIIQFRFQEPFSDISRPAVLPLELSRVCALFFITLSPP